MYESQMWDSWILPPTLYVHVGIMLNMNQSE